MDCNQDSQAFPRQQAAHASSADAPVPTKGTSITHTTETLQFHLEVSLLAVHMEHESHGLKPHVLSNALINAAAILEKSEEQLLPAGAVGSNAGRPTSEGLCELRRSRLPPFARPV